ncbi:hypothetical protein C8J56DRAFT_1156876, partial [Mycena floridula]
MASEAAAATLFLKFLIQYSSIALLYFDYILTFGMEVKYVWRSRFRLSTILYVFCRYALVANILYLLAISNKLNDSLTCDQWYKVIGSLSVLGRLSVVVTMTMRTWVVCGRNYGILIPLALLGVACMVSDIWHLPHLKCSGSSSLPIEILGILMVIFEFISAFLTTFRSFQAFKVGGAWRDQRNGILFLIFEQGLWYFCVMFVLTIASVILNIRGKSGLLQSLLNAHLLPLSCLLTARFLLHLREWEDDHAGQVNPLGNPLSTVEFQTGSTGTIFLSVMDEFGRDPVQSAVLARNLESSSDAEGWIETENFARAARDYPASQMQDRNANKSWGLDWLLPKALQEQPNIASTSYTPLLQDMDTATRPSIDKDDLEHTHEHLETSGHPGYVFKTPEERRVALQEALTVDPGAQTWSFRAIQLYLITLVICCCSGDSGFDGTVMGGINSMAQYQKYFNMTSTGAKTSIVFGIYSIGSVCGTIPASYLPDRFGRRFAMFFGNLVLVVGAVLTANAQNKTMFLIGRWLTGIGSGCAGTSAKSYLAEIVPPQSRGAFMGFLNSFYYVGQMTASGMMVATGRWDNDLSWRLPLYVQFSLALNRMWLFVKQNLNSNHPCRPRWLYSIGKKTEARKILANLHSADGDPDAKSPLINLEMEEIEEKIALGGASKKWWDFRPLFRTRADRYRAYMVILIGAFGQLSGNGLITYFLPVLLKNAGILSQNKQLTLNFVNSITSYIGALTGSFVIDRFGRRKALLTSTATLVVILAIVTGLLSNTGVQSSARANAGIVFIFLFMVVFSFGWTPMQALYPAEVLGYEARAKGLAFLNIVSQVATCINTFGLPVALGKIGWHVYLIFLLWDVFEVVIIYLFVVETKQFTLEEISEIFEAPNPRAYSEKLQKLKIENQNSRT